MFMNKLLKFTLYPNVVLLYYYWESNQTTKSHLIYFIIDWNKMKEIKHFTSLKFYPLSKWCGLADELQGARKWRHQNRKKSWIKKNLKRRRLQVIQCLRSVTCQKIKFRLWYGNNMSFDNINKEMSLSAAKTVTQQHNSMKLTARLGLTRVNITYPLWRSIIFW